MLAAQILFIFKKAADRSFRKDPAFTQSCFLELILRIIVAQDKESRNQSTSATHPFIKLEIQYDWIVAAIKSVISSVNLTQPSLVETLILEGQDLGGLSEDKKQMLIDVLQAVEIQPAHVDEVIDMIQPAQQANLARVKVQLLESKQDYVQALLLYMNNEMLRKQLFKWLFDTMDKLTKKDFELRRGKESTSTQMAFGGKGKRKHGGGAQAPLTESEKLLNDDSDDSDENAGNKNKSTANNGDKTKVDEHEEYEPLVKLKRSLKGRIAELAKHSSESTVKLVETYLSDGDFQDQLIMEVLVKDEQLNYLTSYITKNEETIKRALTNEDVIFSESQNQTVRKYEKYLILFTRLLCRFQGHLVDQWVSKSYFPPDQCLPICREYQNLRGEAILSSRSGKHIEAIDVYLKILTSFPVQRLIAQFRLLYKDKPNFLDYVDLGEAEGQEHSNEQDKKGKEAASSASKQRNHFIPDSFIEFDAVLGKACSICQKDDLDSDQRMKAWFKILRYLQNFMVESFNKVTDGITTAKKEHKDLSIVGIKEEDKPLYIKRMKDFIMDRINYILRFPGLEIPLKMIVEQLNLTFEQIQQLCASKLRHDGTTLKIEQTQQMIIVRQLNDMFDDYVDKRSSGYMVEPNKRFAPNPRPGGRRLIKAHTICNLCMVSIVRGAKQIEPIVIYQCNHQFHQSCLTEKQRAMGFAKCPICFKQNYMAIREEQEQKQRANASQNRGSTKRVGRRPRTGSVAQPDAAANDNEADSRRATTNLDSTMRQSQQFDGDMTFMNESMDTTNRHSGMANRTSVGLDSTMSGNRMSSLLDASMQTNRPNSTMLDGSMGVNDTIMMQADEPNVLSLETIRQRKLEQFEDLLVEGNLGLSEFQQGEKNKESDSFSQQYIMDFNSRFQPQAIR